MKDSIKQMAESIHMPEERQEQILDGIHAEIQKRRTTMRMMTGKKMMIAAAAIAVLAAGTAIGAGKVAYLSSGHNANEVDYTSAKEVMESQKLGGKAKAVQEFADGTSFDKGYFIETNAYDENRNLVGSYPNIDVYYENGLSLDISRPLDGVEDSSYPIVLSETYEEVPIEVTQMDYLFLPPDVKPSEEDQKMKEEGKLEISYGSSEEQRMTFLGASWEEDGLKYLLFTMKDGANAEDLMAKAKEIIDVE